MAAMFLNTILDQANRALERRLGKPVRATASERRKLLRKLRALKGRATMLERDLEKRGPASGVGAQPIVTSRAGAKIYRPQVLNHPIQPSGYCEPESGLRLAPDMELFHDCEVAQFALRQLPVNRPDTSYELVMDGYVPSGTFLSLALTLPLAEAKRTKKDDLIRLSYDIDFERDSELFARLNLKHGPNVEQVVREIDLNSPQKFIEFDVYFTQFDPDRAEGMWIDLIFQPPAMNAISIRDLAVMRRPRASL